MDANVLLFREKTKKKKPLHGVQSRRRRHKGQARWRCVTADHACFCLKTDHAVHVKPSTGRSSAGQQQASFLICVRV